MNSGVLYTRGRFLLACPDALVAFLFGEGELDSASLVAEAASDGGSRSSRVVGEVSEGVGVIVAGSNLMLRE